MCVKITRRQHRFDHKHILGSEYRNALSEGVLRLQEQGKLASLKIKWWKEKKGGGACADTGEDSEALALDIANVVGVFLLLIIGIAAAVVVNIIEMLLAVRTRSVENEVRSAINIKVSAFCMIVKFNLKNCRFHSLKNSLPN